MALTGLKNQRDEAAVCVAQTCSCVAGSGGGRGLKHRKWVDSETGKDQGSIPLRVSRRNAGVSQSTPRSAQ